MGIILVPLCILYMFAVALVVILVYRFITASKFVMIALIAIGVLLPTYDIIITNALGAYYCKADPNPKTFIKEKVEYPESIYWEDNIFGGFDVNERRQMVQNYLDGIHLKTMALNGDDGKVYVYYYEDIPKEYYSLKQEYAIVTKRYINCRNDWNIAYDSNDLKYKKIGKECTVLSKKQDELRGILNKKINTFVLKEEIYNKPSVAQMNYTVTFDEVKLNFFARKFLYSDETKVVNNKTDEIIAYNRRYMHFFYNIAPDFALGNRYYSSWDWETCGWNRGNTQYFFKDVFEKINTITNAIPESFSSKLYRKYKKGE